MQQGQDADNVGLPNLFQLGDWQVQPALGRISAQGQEHKLEPRVMEVLVYLAEHQGEVISRDDLERAVWRGAIVSYDAVTGTIIKLRKALDDRARQPRYIETIPKKGYRLIAVVKLSDADVSAPLDTGPAGGQSPETPPAGGLGHVVDRAAAVPAGQSASGRWVSRLIVLVLVLAVGAWLMLANDAQQVVAPPTLSLPDRPSLAVMPFENLSGDPANDYFSDGMTDDLITDLSQLQGLFVIGRHSAFSYTREQLDPPAIARDLGVRYLMVGSVRRGGDTLRVNAQLIDAIRGEQLWAERFDGAVDDVFTVQDRINARIVEALALRLSDAETQRIAGTPTTSAPAYDAYLKGMQHFWRGSADDYDEAVRYLEQAIGIDLDFAEAHAALAAIHWQAYKRGWYRNQPWMGLAWEKTMNALEQALKRPTSLAYFVDSGIYTTNRRFEQAIAQARKAVQQFPNDAYAHLALADALSFAGQPVAARRSAETGLRLDPRFPAPYSFAIGRAQFEMGDYQDAANTLTEAVTLNDADVLPRILLVSALGHLGRTDAGKQQLEALNAQYQRDHLRRLNIRDLGEAWPYRDADDLARLKEGLRMLGVNEW
ncbi:MAG: winged helix-turn-helix domain-containing protein [Chromatiaceae bacterium]|jgi:TolB-like protein/DNA-binding winged helix-turn-helix (wHTH) protein